MSSKKYITFAVLAVSFTGLAVVAQNNTKADKKAAKVKKSKKAKKPKKKTQSERANALSPEEQLKLFKVPEGFVVELVASEKNGLINPIDIAFDPAGRMWTGTARMYPLDPVGSVGRKMLEKLQSGAFDGNPAFKKMRNLYQRKTKGTDQVLIIENPTEQVKGQIPVFAEGMTIPQSFIPYKGGVYVAHGSEMLYLGDKDNDGKADSQDIVLTGFGFTDTHTMSHTLVRGPGGWVNFSHGALNIGKVTAVKSGQSAVINYSKIARFSLDGEKLEVVNNGLNNIWGFTLKGNGQWYGTEANDLFFSLIPLHPYMGYKGIGNDRLRPYQPFVGEFHNFKVNGTGISGLAYDENGSKGFPKEWKNAGFLANPITSKINAVIADRNPDGSVISKHLPDFLTCDDDWFRPVNIEFGPDGCLYIVDWYNKIVSHNEVDRNHPDRDRSMGRIWRVRHKSQTPGAIANIAEASNIDLLKHLKAEILWEKRSAWTEIVDRGAKELIPDLNKIVTDKSLDKVTRIHALWSLEGLAAFNLEVLESLTADTDPDIKREALRSLETFKPAVEDIVALTKPLLNDSHYMVREQVLRTLGDVGVANSETIKMLVSAANPSVVTVENNILPLGKSYESNFQSFLAFMALEKYPIELQLFLESPGASGLPKANLNEATKLLPQGARGKKLVESLLDGTVELDVKTLVAIASSLNDLHVLNKLSDKLATKDFVLLALEAQSSLQSSLLHKALEPGLKKLFASSDAPDHQLAVRTVISFQHPGMNAEIVKLVTKNPLKEITAQYFDALCVVPKQNIELLKKIASDQSVSLSSRTRAGLSVFLGDTNEGLVVLSNTYAKASEEEKKSIVSNLASYEQGMLFILNLLQQKKITPDQLDSNIKAKMIFSHSSHPESAVLAEQVKRLKAQQSKEGDAKVNKYATAYKQLKGDVNKGKQYFAICLQCHQAGKAGLDLAPSLDGSKNRDIHHMLTAIVKPNDAIEGGYRVYRITKKTGTFEEGYMNTKNANGTTIATMGGATKFIPKEQIKYEEFVDGQSFMISAFGGYSDQYMADLLSYLKTLK